MTAFHWPSVSSLFLSWWLRGQVEHLVCYFQKGQEKGESGCGLNLGPHCVCFLERGWPSCQVGVMILSSLSGWGLKATSSGLSLLQGAAPCAGS